MNDNKTKILVVDDDMRLRDLLKQYLGEQGYAVTDVPDGSTMDQALAREPFDLMVLDLMLPKEDGLSICRRLRAVNNLLPIIMLTAKGDEVDRITGLETGADDYMPKPFNPRELVARIQAVLRRQQPASRYAANDLNQSFNFGPFTANLSTRTLTREGRLIELTTGEFSLLKAFVNHPREPLSRERLAELARGRDLEMFDRSIDIQVSRLRKLIETDSAKPAYIQTVWGLGYVFVPEGKSP
jgi:two-component system, OmpR family, phosphate regulon response regulator OmpR